MNVGKITAAEIWAESGSPDDIQAAVDAVVAAGGGTVYIPEGEFSFIINSEKKGADGHPTGVNIPGGVNIIGAGINKTILKVPSSAPYKASMFSIDGSNGKPVRISGITFHGYVVNESEGNVGIIVLDTKDFRIDHCKFLNFASFAIYSKKTLPTTIHRGVIDHCIIDNPYKESPSPTGSWQWGYGIGVFGDGVTWLPLDELLGKYEDNVVYIDDNIFHRCRHSIASNEGGYYVARYNVFDSPIPPNFGIIDVHGVSGYEEPGGRGLEAYGNIIIGAKDYDASQAFWIRGGGGVIFNNTMQNILYGVGLYKENPNPEYWVKDLYIWNNSMDRGELINNYGNYTENADYFLYAKSGYTPFPYPHPLTLQD